MTPDATDARLLRTETQELAAKLIADCMFRLGIQSKLTFTHHESVERRTKAKNQLAVMNHAICKAINLLDAIDELIPEKP